MEISKLDHLVLTVKDFEKTVSFYVSVMGKGPNCGAERRRRSRLHSTQWTGVLDAGMYVIQLSYHQDIGLESPLLRRSGSTLPEIVGLSFELL